LPIEMQAFVAALLPGAVASAVLQQVLDGTTPWDTDTPLEDLFYGFRTGGLDRNGHPNRGVIPGYGPAYYAMMTRFGGHFLNAMAPVPRRMLEAFQNERFYDRTFVADPAAEPLKQITGRLAWALFGNWPVIGEGPFFESNIKRAVEQNQSPAAAIAGGFGLRPASTRLDLTDFEKKIDAIRSRTMPAGRPKDEADRQRRLAILRDQVRAGGDAGELLRSGDFSLRETKSIAGASRLMPYQSKFAGLGIKQALEAWPLASSAEQDKYRAILQGKLFHANGSPKSDKFGRPSWEAAYPPSELPILREQLQRAISGQSAAQP